MFCPWRNFNTVPVKWFRRNVFGSARFFINRCKQNRVVWISFTMKLAKNGNARKWFKVQVYSRFYSQSRSFGYKEYTIDNVITALKYTGNLSVNMLICFKR